MGVVEILFMVLSGMGNFGKPELGKLTDINIQTMQVMKTLIGMVM
jgi:hypothetical protein